MLSMFLRAKTQGPYGDDRYDRRPPTADNQRIQISCGASSYRHLNCLNIRSSLLLVCERTR